MLNSVIKTGFEQKISKNYNCLKKNSVFKMQIYLSTYKPPPPPPRKIWQKGPLTEKSPGAYYGNFTL